MTTPQMLVLGQAIFGFACAVGNIVLLVGEMDVAGVGYLSGFALRSYFGCGLGLWLLAGAARAWENPPEPEANPDSSARWGSGVVGVAVIVGCLAFAAVKFPTFGANVYAGTIVVLWCLAVIFGVYYLTWAINPLWYVDGPAPPAAEPEPEPEQPPAPKPWHRPRTARGLPEPDPDERDD